MAKAEALGAGEGGRKVLEKPQGAQNCRALPSGIKCSACLKGRRSGGNLALFMNIPSPVAFLSKRHNLGQNHSISTMKVFVAKDLAVSSEYCCAL